MSGILEKWLFREGEPVKAGQMLFRIERAPFEIALSQARAALEREAAETEAGEAIVKAIERVLADGRLPAGRDVLHCCPHTFRRLIRQRYETVIPNQTTASENQVIA